MKTIEQIKNDVAVKHGYKDWNNIMRGAQFLFIDEVATEYAKKILENKPFGFGSYCNVEQKRYGANNEFYCYKVISVIKSNTWIDVPVDARVNKAVNHNTMEEVVTCICMGVSEDTVVRFRLSDVIQSSTPKLITIKQ